MAKANLLQSVSTLSKKIDSLLDYQNSQAETISRLERENNELKLQHKKDMEALEKAYRDIEFLSLSHRLADSPEALIAARNSVSQLIRTIDSCIRMIKED